MTLDQVRVMTTLLEMNGEVGLRLFSFFAHFSRKYTQREETYHPDEIPSAFVFTAPTAAIEDNS